MVILPIVSIPIGLMLAYQLRANHPHPKPIPGDDKVRLKASVGFDVPIDSSRTTAHLPVISTALAAGAGV